MTNADPPPDPAGDLGWLDDMLHPPPIAPPQASDPIQLPTGQLVPRAVPPAVGGGSFTVDRERAPEAIRELEGAVAELEDIRRQASILGRVVPPSADLVSRDAAQALSAVAVGGQGSLLQALDADIRQINALIVALREDLRGYDDVERNTASTLRRS